MLETAYAPSARVPDAFENAFRDEPQERLDPTLEKSIFEYYNIPNEVSFLKNYPEFPQEQKEYYLQENVKTFLAEFAGKVPFKTITYVLRDDGLYYGDIKAVDNYKKTAHMPEATSRERTEGSGFEQVNNGFVQGKTSACWISPPKIADYGFVFYFSKEEYDERLQGHKVKEHIVRYPEKMHQITNSNRIAQELNIATHMTAEEFIANPTLTTTQDLDQETHNVLKASAITDRDIKDSQLFDEAVSINLSPLIKQYVNLIVQLSTLPPNSWQATIEETNAKELLINLFTQAKVLKRQIAEPKNFGTVNFENDPAALMYYAGRETATVDEGGSCPSIKRSTGEMLSATDIYSLLRDGNPLESALHGESDYYDDYDCPDCKKSISGEKKNDPSSWRTNCPHCGSNAISCRK